WAWTLPRSARSTTMQTASEPRCSPSTTSSPRQRHTATGPKRSSDRSSGRWDKIRRYGNDHNRNGRPLREEQIRAHHKRHPRRRAGGHLYRRVGDDHRYRPRYPETPPGRGGVYHRWRRRTGAARPLEYPHPRGDVAVTGLRG